MTVEWEAFIAHLVHDVRGLARQGLSHAQLLQRETSSGPSQNHLSAIVASQQKLDRLLARVMRLVEAARADRAALWSDLQELDLLLLGAKLDQKTALSEAGAELSIHPMPASRIPAKLQAVFSELLQNATQFRDPARPLRIDVRGTLPAPGSLRVIVSDNGLGWDEAYTGKLFQPFERLHTGAGSFGLGLLTCRLLVEAAGGSISGQPHVPGASFVMDVPFSED